MEASGSSSSSSSPNCDGKKPQLAGRKPTEEHPDPKTTKPESPDANEIGSKDNINTSERKSVIEGT